MSIRVIGTGGHAKVVLDLLKKIELDQHCAFISKSNQRDISPLFHAYPFYSEEKDTIKSLLSEKAFWHVAIGEPTVRKDKMHLLEQERQAFITLLHPQSICATQLNIGCGSLILAGAIINLDAHIGKGCILNTAATVDHDCLIEDFVNIGPGVHLAGGVHVGSCTSIGTGAAVTPNITIGSHCVIGAGAVVVSDIPDCSLAIGVPAKVIKRHNIR